MPEISDKTKAKVASMTDSKKIPKQLGADSFKEEHAKVLGQIYDLMVKMREDELKAREEAKNQQQSLEKEEDDRQEKLKEALRGKKPEAKKEKKEKKKKKASSGNLGEVIAGGAVLAGAEKKQEEEEKKVTEEKKEYQAKVEPAPKPAAPAEEVKPPPVATPPEVPKAEAPKVEVKKEPEKPVQIPKVEPAKKEAPTEAPKAEKKKEEPAQVKGVPGLIARDLAEAGVSQKGQANVLAQVEAESGFKPKNENLNYKSAQRIQDVFGKNRIPTLEFAEKLVNNPEGLADVVYAKTDGNSQPGDGSKYRGRGFLQHTGKNQYVAIKKYTGVDVVSDPDKLNDPVVAAKAVPWFFLDYKRKKPQQLDNLSEVNKAVGFAGGDKEAQHRASLVAKYDNIEPAPATPVSTPTSAPVAAASKDNQNLKESLNKDKSSITVNNNTTTATSETKVAAKSDTVDDRPIYLRKSVA